ncbi:uncharacterized protein LOC111055833 [Nilaparvata lugens]|uniref:uncharacterized protein LOC111055833 n=1 Tax=Nilaparvata lugens TaxID=108931 RepID=UPI000B98A370|nr:uncharacterized protein LOC111055833 [Nilaparvata lugens]
MSEFNGNVTPFKTSTDCMDMGLFKFENGDRYIGCFTANIKRELFREGFGKYFCNNGDSYCGLWRKDNLVAAKSITYKNRHTYSGELSRTGMQMEGIGTYKIPSIGDLHVVFEGNKPTGEINLVDVSGFCWKGKCNDDGVTLYPVNQFKIYREQAMNKDPEKIESD